MAVAPVLKYNAAIKQNHRPGSPAHGDKAFQNHHVVKGPAALFFGGNGPRNQGRLTAMKAGEDATGDSDKEDRNKLLTEGMLGFCRR